MKPKYWWCLEIATLEVKSETPKSKRLCTLQEGQTEGHERDKGINKKNRVRRARKS